MRLSIITINYNNLSGLRKTVDSVLAQTWRDFEWIIVDGGSTDGSKELIEEIAARPDSQISYWCSESDKGIYNAMNKGISKAKGEYYLFLNSGDTLFDSNVLKTVFAEAHHVDLLYGDAVMVYPDGYSYTKYLPDDLSLEFFFRDTIVHQATFIKKEIFDRFTYDEKLRIASDLKLWMQCIINQCSYEHLPFRVCSFDMTGIGTTSQHSEERQTIFDELFPKPVQDNLQELARYKQIYPQLPRVCQLLRTRRIYKRISDLSIRLMELISKLFDE